PTISDQRSGTTVADGVEGFRVAGFTSEKILTGNENPDSMARVKTKTIGLILALCFSGWAACFAADPQMGTWKLNEARSKFTPGTAKFTTVTFKNMFGNIKVASDGTAANGQRVHVEWSGKFDGKDYPVTGSPDSDARSYTKVNDRTLQVTAKKNGKV